MMHYVAEGIELMKPLSSCDGGDGEEKASAGAIITTAIKMYTRSNQTTRDRVVEMLSPINSIITMERVELCDDTIVTNPMDTAFNSFCGPNQMRCLALVSHNGMKKTMMNFVRANKNVLKKFCLTGTNSTMKMLRGVFEGDDSVMFGPSCASG